MQGQLFGLIQGSHIQIQMAVHSNAGIYCKNNHFTLQKCTQSGIWSPCENAIACSVVASTPLWWELHWVEQHTKKNRSSFWITHKTEIYWHAKINTSFYVIILSLSPNTYITYQEAQYFCTASKILLAWQMKFNIMVPIVIITWPPCKNTLEVEKLLS